MPSGSGNLVVVGTPVQSGDPAVLDAAAAVGAAKDRSARSDELGVGADDRLGRRHRSPVRADVLAALDLAPGERVLEVGAGTGAVTRHLAERRLAVVAVEADLDAARVVQQRVAGFDVEVVAGTFADAAPVVGSGFDVVLLLDLPVWAEVPAALGRAVSALAPGGVVVAALANPLGVHRLASAPSVDGAWIGDGQGSRAALLAVLDEVGLGAHRWLFPFPDHVLPTAIVTESLLEGGSRFDRLVADLVPDDGRSAALVGDVRTAYAALRAAGLGADLAPSVLVVAGRDEAAVAPRIAPDVVAWLPGGHRRRAFRVEREVRVTPEGLVVDTVDPPRPTTRRSAWLVQRAGGREPFVDGDDLAGASVARIRAGDEAGLAGLLRSWAGAVPSVGPPREPPHHPFADAATTNWAPATALEVDLRLAVRTGSGLVLLDGGLAADAPVDRDLVRFRALWHHARWLVVTGVPHPWPLDLPVDGLALGLAERAGVPVDERTLDRFRTAERALQTHLSLLGPESIDAYLAHDRSVAGERAAGGGAIADTVAGAANADRRRIDAERRTAAAEARVDDLEARVAALDGEVLRLTSEWYSMKAAVVIAEQARLDAIDQLAGGAKG